MFYRKIMNFAAATMISAVILGFSACSGDMHDEDELNKSYIMYSLSNKTLSIPAKTVFNQDWYASNVEGTYDGISFSSVEIKTDSFNPISYMELKDEKNEIVYTDKNNELSHGTASYTLEKELKIKINEKSVVSSFDFNGLKPTN